jgi:hypothetical protein
MESTPMSNALASIMQVSNTLVSITPTSSDDPPVPPLSSPPPIRNEADDAVNELDGDPLGVVYVETLLLSVALWWGLWRSARRLTRRH